MRLYILRFIAVDTSQRSNVGWNTITLDFPLSLPFAARDSPPTFPSLPACWRKREICRGTKTSLMEKLDARREGRRVSTIPFDSVYLRDSKLTVLYTSLSSKIRLLFHGHNLTLNEDILKAETRNRVTKQNVN